MANYYGGLNTGAAYRSLLAKKRLGMPLTEQEINTSLVPSLYAKADYAAQVAAAGADRKLRARAINLDYNLRDRALSNQEDLMAAQNRASSLRGGLDTLLLAKELYGSRLGQSTISGVKSLFPTGAAAETGAGTLGTYETGNTALTLGNPATFDAGGYGVAETTPAATSSVNAATTGTETVAGGSSSLGGYGVLATIAAGDYLGRTSSRITDGQKTMGAIEAIGNRRTAFNDPFQSRPNEELGLGPTAGESLDAAMANRDPKLTRRYAASAALDFAQPYASTFARKMEEKFGETAGIFADPLGAMAKKFGEEVDDASVICTELHRQGFMPDHIYALDSEFGKTVDREVYAGYRKMADPVVKLMQKYFLVTLIVSLFAIPWALHMAHVMKPDRYEGNLLGRVIMRIGMPLCRFIGKSREVQSWAY